MILEHKLLSLTEDEQAVLTYAVSQASCSKLEYHLNDIKLVKVNWLKNALTFAKQLIKAEHVEIISSIEKKLF